MRRDAVCIGAGRSAGLAGGKSLNLAQVRRNEATRSRARSTSNRLGDLVLGERMVGSSGGLHGQSLQR